MHVLITSPQGKNQEYDVVAVAGTNAQGDFSILANHTRFLTIVTGEVQLYPQAVFDEKPDPIKIEVGTGILRCLTDRVEIYRNLVTINYAAPHPGSIATDASTHDTSQPTVAPAQTTPTPPPTPQAQG